MAASISHSYKMYGDMSQDAFKEGALSSSLSERNQ
jgi:hypothetical protein